MHQNFFLAALDERAHRVFPKVSNDGMRAFHSMRAGPYTLMARLLFPALDKTVQKSAQAQVFVDAARVACALERYRLANGTFPETLEKLSPVHMEKVPTDVIDGKPLRYTRDAGTSYVLYSIGWNQTDDAGSPGLILKNAESFADLTKGDWVWQMPAKL
jgi:hypothetical protein